MARRPVAGKSKAGKDARLTARRLLVASAVTTQGGARAEQGREMGRGQPVSVVTESLTGGDAQQCEARHQCPPLFSRIR